MNGGPGQRQTPSRSMGESSDDVFPRGRALPRQSPLFWVDQKDRYLRQLLIRDIEAITGRALIAYFTDTGSSAQIDDGDDRYLVELLHDARGRPLDLLLETNGGFTDATEKLVSVLTASDVDLRVVVPRRAKSNGTLLALAGTSVVMGQGSELGPMDPLIIVQPGVPVPAQYIVESQEGSDPFLRRLAEHAILQTRKLATMLLASGMMRGRREAEIEAVVGALASRDVYHSHGSVIDAREAQALGLNVTWLETDDEVWGRFWLLRTMYEADAQRGGFVKIFEGRTVSNAIRRA
jgi:hypothetical protein